MTDDQNPSGRRSIQAGILGVGSVSATVQIWGFNDARFPELIATITLSGTNRASESFMDSFPWEFYRADVTAISGTGANVSVAASI